MNVTLRRQARRIARWFRGKQPRYRPTRVASKVWYGTEYGGFYVSPKSLGPETIVYSIGIGEDISFDLAMILNHGCHVFGFDPTPRVAQWIGMQKAIPNEFHFHPLGLGAKTGVLQFFLPKNDKNVSGSFVAQANVDTERTVEVEMRTFSDLMQTLEHSRVDVIKMDIEGIEYEVLDSILILSEKSGVSQILIEFHDRFFEDGAVRTKEAIAKLESFGFHLFAASDSCEEMSFLRDTCK
jgi:FkbM family methyltransferase